MLRGKYEICKRLTDTLVEFNLKEGNHQGTHWITNKVARSLVLVIGSLAMVAFDQMLKGRRWLPFWYLTRNMFHKDLNI